MDQEQAELIAKTIGGTALMSGGDVWVVILDTDTGKVMLGLEGWGFDNGADTLLPEEILGGMS
jgi:hypothetical protein